jgi:hypothetical protein
MEIADLEAVGVEVGYYSLVVCPESLVQATRPGPLPLHADSHATDYAEPTNSCPVPINALSEEIQCRHRLVGRSRDGMDHLFRCRVGVRSDAFLDVQSSLPLAGSRCSLGVGMS